MSTLLDWLGVHVPTDDTTTDTPEMAEARARGGVDGCPTCHGTGVDEAFGTSCYVCVRGDGRPVPAAPRAAAPVPHADRPPAPDAGELLAWLRAQCDWSFVARRICATVDKGGRLTPSLADQGDSLRAKCEAKRPGSTRMAATPTDAPAPTAPRPPITEGLWRVNEEAFRVSRSGSSGRLYAARLDPRSGRWQFAPGAMRTVAAGGVPMTREQAAAYGRRSGRCCCCGRELTDPASIAAGIGPVCAAKF